MKIDITLKYLREFAKENPRVETMAKRDLYWGQAETRAEFEISNLEIDELEAFQSFLKQIYNETTEETTKGMANACLQKISALIKVKSDPLVPIKSLDTLASALTEYIRKSPQRWIFKMQTDNRNLPHLVTNIKYNPSLKDSPAYVSMEIRHVYLDEVKVDHEHWHMESLVEDPKLGKKMAGFNVQQLLDKKGYILGIQDLINQYEAEAEVYFKYRDMIGEQFTSSSIGYEIGRWRGSDATALNTDGTPHKLIVNEALTRKIVTEDKTSSAAFWNESDDSAILRTPLHMYIKMFNLRNHDNFSVHTSTLTPYIYDTKLIEKLILPSEVKELVEILGRGAAEGLGDIISGKAEGIIVGCVGGPGLGKTLSAEVYSEFLQRPLYSVQCAQLGTNANDLEKKLTEVLENAQRWKAVLLLDEADVYIRERGKDIQQNAIVGVFLRVLEYYRGIIFLTTNLADSIDDAIESRFSAKIVFDYPSKEAAKSIWAIQVANHGWKVDEEMIEALVEENPYLSGRSIRSLLKLSTLLARYRKIDLTLDILKHAAKFAVLTSKKDKAVIASKKDAPKTDTLTKSN